MTDDRDDLEKALAEIDERAEAPDGDLEEVVVALDGGLVPDVELDAEPPSRHASPVRVVGIAAVFLIVLGAIGYLAVPRGGTLEPQDVADDLFAAVDAPLPFGFVPREARKLPSGEQLLRYGPEGDGSTDGPRELTIIEYPPKRGESVLTEQFRSLRFESGDGGWGGGRRGRRGGRGGPPGMGGDSRPKLQEKGHLRWHGYEATFARLRHGERAKPWGMGGAPGGESGESDGAANGEDGTDAEAVADAESGTDAEVGTGADGENASERADGPSPSAPSTVYETVRINLSTGGRCIIAYVRFADGATATKDEASALVRAFTPKS